MNKIALQLASSIALLALAACTGADVGSEDDEVVDQVSSGKIIGENDLTVVLNNGANIPKKYGPLVNAFGRMSMGCTATHIGGGVVVTAGHCFNAPSTRKDNVPCANVKVEWGLRKDSASYLTSQCKIILSEQTNRDKDWAIFTVEPAPPAEVAVDFAARPSVDTNLTIFGHPRRRPLEWSKTCKLKSASAGGWGAGQFSHQCDTEPGNSGSTILNDDNLKVVGIHDGGNTSWNYGTYLSDTPLAEFVGPNKKKPAPVVTPEADTTEEETTTDE